MQLNLVKNLNWLDFSKLEDFPNEAKQILSLNKLLSEERINKITEEIKKNWLFKKFKKVYTVLKIISIYSVTIYF